MTVASNIALALAQLRNALGEACVYDAGGTPVTGTGVFSVQAAGSQRDAAGNWELRLASIVLPKATFATLTPGKTITRTADAVVYTISAERPPTDDGFGCWEATATARVEIKRGVY
jgi:hypothetical protein